LPEELAAFRDVRDLPVLKTSCGTGPCRSKPGIVRRLG
jgi:hypothetical protein